MRRRLACDTAASLLETLALPLSSNDWYCLHTSDQHKVVVGCKVSLSLFLLSLSFSIFLSFFLSCFLVLCLSLPPPPKHCSCCVLLGAMIICLPKLVAYINLPWPHNLVLRVIKQFDPMGKPANWARVGKMRFRKRDLG